MDIAGVRCMQVDDTLDLFNELQLQHQAVATKTKTLHDACDRLVRFTFYYFLFYLVLFFFLASLDLMARSLILSYGFAER